MFSLMLFMFLFFIGFVAMFFYLIRKQDNLQHLISDEHAQLRVLLRAAESRLESLENEAYKFKDTDRGDGSEDIKLKDKENAEYDALLRLSFDMPKIQKGDPNLDLHFEPENNTRTQDK